MSFEGFPSKVSEPELFRSVVKFVGGSAAVTKVYGVGVTVTYIGTGLVDLTWSEAQGEAIGLLGAPAFTATTAAAVKGHTVVAGVYNATTRTVRLNITNASEALHDLAALEWLTLEYGFKRSTVGGS